MDSSSRQRRAAAADDPQAQEARLCRERRRRLARKRRGRTDGRHAPGSTVAHVRVSAAGCRRAAVAGASFAAERSSQSALQPRSAGAVASPVDGPIIPSGRFERWRVRSKADCMMAGVGSDLEVALLTGGWDPPYAFGLSHALFAQGVRLDVICGDDLNVGRLDREHRVAILRFLKDGQPASGPIEKLSRLVAYYARLVGYAWSARPKIFHILWNNRFQTLDRVFLMLYYRLLGKRIVLTAHNVNAGTRDATDSFFNRL